MNLVKRFIRYLIYVMNRLLELFWYGKEPVSLKCLVGRTAIVTGGYSGIGYATAMTLASRGCRVILADCQNGEESRDRIISTTGNKEIVYKHIDLASLQSVRNFASDICRTEEKIDILINNAGLGITRKTVSEDGLNFLMQVNIFGAFLLTHLLLEPLKKSKSARVIFISSITTFLHNLSLDNLNITDYEMNDSFRKMLYSNSKTCCVLAGQEFGRKLQKYGITSNSIDPFAVRTPIFNTLGDLGEMFLVLFFKIGLYIFAKDPLDVANCYLHVITNDDPIKINGKNFVLCNVGGKPNCLKNKQFCEDIWSKMEELVKLKPEERISS